MFPKLINPKVLYVNLCGLIMMQNQGKVDGSLFSIKKEIQVTIKKNFDVLEIEILFYKMTYMMIIFQFIIIMLKNPILKIDLSKKKLMHLVA
jgi:hypothetical protein